MNNSFFEGSGIMKKVIKIILIIFLLLLLLQLIVTIFTKEYINNYSLKTKENTFLINEHFHDKRYDIVITDKNKEKYIFTVSHNYHKEKNIIKNVNYFETKNLTCLYPVLKKSFSSDLYCLYNKKQVTLSFLETLDDENIKDFLTQMSKKKLTNSLPKESSKEKFSNISIYKNNILPNYTYLLWNYKGLYIVNSKKTINEKFLSKDKYENTLATLLDNYYIYIDTTKENYKEINYYDLKKNKNYTYKIKDYNLSKRIYFNGLYNHELYLTDLDTKKEYKFNPKKKKFYQINELDSYYVVKDNKLVTITKSKFFSNKVYFDGFIKNEKITDLYKTKEIKYVNNYYYFKVKNKIYKALKNHEKSAILLFELPSIKEWNIKDDDLTVVSDDTFYLYNDEVGLLKLIQSNELRYNYKNICHLWKNKK